MENVTLAVVTLTLFMLLFVVAIFADRAGAQIDGTQLDEGVVPIPVEAMHTQMMGDEPTTLSA